MLTEQCADGQDEQCTVTTMFGCDDAYALERLVGSKHAERMVAGKEKAYAFQC